MHGRVWARARSELTSVQILVVVAGARAGTWRIEEEKGSV